MKIAVIGTQNTGKTTYINDFLSKWTMFKKPETTYRDIIKEKNLPHSKEGTEESQNLILNAMVDEIINSSKDENVIFDRCVLDVLAYTTWLCINEKVSPTFVDKQRLIVRETLRLYDILFFIPLTKAAKIEIEKKEDGARDTDPVYREEIDNIFKVFQESWYRSDDRIFPRDDTPAIIEIFGTPEQRIKLTEFYITPEGKIYGEDQSLISDIVPATPEDVKSIESRMLKG
jgi:hypothetical protein